ncbi:thiamine/thiamine pyrophosphate ABC transporter permease ThiP, partial [Klebsiella pneumoniae]|nr:thiamine/thiamine pyrophosphate ABC transporter permease ThiP [Klebsiella pneumoniae]
LGCCVTLVLLSQRFSKAIPAGTSQLNGWRDPQDSRGAQLVDALLILLALILLLPPLAAVIIDCLHGGLRGALAQPALWQATFTSLRIATGAGL